MENKGFNRKGNKVDWDFRKKIWRAEQGKKIFSQKFEIEKLNLEDTFLLVLTNNRKCVEYGIQYLNDFIKLYGRRYVYVLLDYTQRQYGESFRKKGGTVKFCETKEMECISAYLELFKEYGDKRMIFLTEKNELNGAIEELLERKEFSLEEYVVISLYQLHDMKLESVCMYG